MRDPVRIVADPGLSAALRRDLARATSAAPRFDLERQASRFEASIGASPALPTSGSSASAGLPAVKLALVALAIGGAIAAVVAHGSHEATAPVAPVEAVAPAPRSPVDEAPAPPPEASAPPVIETASAVAPAVAPPAIPRPGRSAAPLASASSSPNGDLVAETAELAEVRAAIGDPARALSLADDGHRRFPHGVFWVEREAIAIGALARLGRESDARARAEAFLALHAESPFAASVRRSAGLLREERKSIDP